MMSSQPSPFRSAICWLTLPTPGSSVRLSTLYPADDPQYMYSPSLTEGTRISGKPSLFRSATEGKRGPLAGSATSPLGSNPFGPPKRIDTVSSSMFENSRSRYPSRFRSAMAQPIAPRLGTPLRRDEESPSFAPQKMDEPE